VLCVGGGGVGGVSSGVERDGSCLGFAFRNRARPCRRKSPLRKGTHHERVVERREDVRHAEHVLALARVGHVGLDFLHHGGRDGFFDFSLRGVGRCGSFVVSVGPGMGVRCPVERLLMPNVKGPATQQHGKRTMVFCCVCCGVRARTERGNLGGREAAETKCHQTEFFANSFFSGACMGCNGGSHGMHGLQSPPFDYTNLVTCWPCRLHGEV
jgi:hypothetical protein